MIDLKNITLKEKIELFKTLYTEISGKGIKGDSELAHINEFEARLLKMYGGSGTINEETGLRQYFGGVDLAEVVVDHNQIQLHNLLEKLQELKNVKLN
jgi:hypothetical protein